MCSIYTLKYSPEIIAIDEFTIASIRQRGIDGTQMIQLSSYFSDKVILSTFCFIQSFDLIDILKIMNTIKTRLSIYLTQQLNRDEQDRSMSLGQKQRHRAREVDCLLKGEIERVVDRI